MSMLENRSFRTYIFEIYVNESEKKNRGRVANKSIKFSASDLRANGLFIFQADVHVTAEACVFSECFWWRVLSN